MVTKQIVSSALLYMQTCDLAHYKPDSVTLHDQHVQPRPLTAAIGF
jgi:hypothetical protein